MKNSSAFLLSFYYWIIQCSPVKQKELTDVNVIEVQNLTKDYGHGRGIFDVSFSVAKGETLGFLGPNGAGKSTTMRHLMGFSKPQSGNAKINSMDCSKNYSRILENVGYLPGEVALPEGLNGTEFIKMMQGMRKNKNNDRVNYLLNTFKLDPSGSVKKMSIGEKRKLAVVTAFLDDPDILLLDEPTSGLDPVMQEVFIDFIRGEKKQGKTILLSSHIFSEVEAVCDRIAIIKDGKLVSTVNADDVKHGLKNIFTLTFSVKSSFEKFIKNDFTFDKIFFDVLKCNVLVNDEDTNKFINEVSKYQLTGMQEHSVSLEEYFMHFYENDKKFGGVK